MIVAEEPNGDRKRQGRLSRGCWKRTTGVGRDTRRPVGRAVAEMLRASRLGRKRPGAVAPPDRRRVAPGRFAQRARSQRLSAQREGVPRPHRPPRLSALRLRASTPHLRATTARLRVGAHSCRARAQLRVGLDRPLLRPAAAPAVRAARDPRAAARYSRPPSPHLGREPHHSQAAAHEVEQASARTSRAPAANRVLCHPSPRANHLTRSLPATVLAGAGRSAIISLRLNVESCPLRCALSVVRALAGRRLGRALAHRRRPRARRAVGTCTRIGRTNPMLLLGRSTPQQRCEAAVGPSTHRLSLR